MAVSGEPELDAGEAPGQLAAQHRDEVRGGLVFLGQRDLDLAVQRADGAGVAVRQVDAGVGHAGCPAPCPGWWPAHQLADLRLDLVGQPRRLLDARAGGHAGVQADLAAVDGQEEVAASAKNNPPAAGRTP